MSGEMVTWSKDYSTVDECEVRLIDHMETMDLQAFDVYFGSDRTWSLVLSNGRMVTLREDGENQAVEYEDRAEYATLVRQHRMGESDQQVMLIQ